METAEMMQHLMWAGVGAISVTAVFAIIVVLVGGFNEFTVKALASTFVLGYYCLTTAATFGGGSVVTTLSFVGAGIAVLGLVVSLPVIWSKNHGWSDGTVKTALILAVVAFGLALGCIDFRMAGSSVASVYMMFAAVASVVVVTLMMVSLIVSEGDLGSGFYRVLIALTILMVALSILNPIIAKMA